MAKVPQLFRKTPGELEEGGKVAKWTIASISRGPRRPTMYLRHDQRPGKMVVWLDDSQKWSDIDGGDLHADGSIRKGGKIHAGAAGTFQTKIRPGKKLTDAQMAVLRMAAKREILIANLRARQAKAAYDLLNDLLLKEMGSFKIITDAGRDALRTGKMPDLAAMAEVKAGIARQAQDLEKRIADARSILGAWGDVKKGAARDSLRAGNFGAQIYWRPDDPVTVSARHYTSGGQKIETPTKAGGEYKTVEQALLAVVRDQFAQEKAAEKVAIAKVRKLEPADVSKWADTFDAVDNMIGRAERVLKFEAGPEYEKKRREAEALRKKTQAALKKKDARAAAAAFRKWYLASFDERMALDPKLKAEADLRNAQARKKQLEDELKKAFEGRAQPVPALWRPSRGNHVGRWRVTEYRASREKTMPFAGARGTPARKAEVVLQTEYREGDPPRGIMKPGAQYPTTLKLEAGEWRVRDYAKDAEGKPEPRPARLYTDGSIRTKRGKIIWPAKPKKAPRKEQTKKKVRDEKPRAVMSVEKDGSKWRLYRLDSPSYPPKQMIFKFPTKRSASAIADAWRTGTIDKGKAELVFRDMVKDWRRLGHAVATKHAFEMLVYVLRGAVSLPDWWPTWRADVAAGRVLVDEKKPPREKDTKQVPKPKDLKKLDPQDLKKLEESLESQLRKAQAKSDMSRIQDLVAQRDDVRKELRSRLTGKDAQKAEWIKSAERGRRDLWKKLQSRSVSGVIKDLTAPQRKDLLRWDTATKDEELSKSGPRARGWVRVHVPALVEGNGSWTPFGRKLLAQLQPAPAKPCKKAASTLGKCRKGALTLREQVAAEINQGANTIEALLASPRLKSRQRGAIRRTLTTMKKKGEISETKAGKLSTVVNGVLVEKSKKREPCRTAAKTLSSQPCRKPRTRKKKAAKRKDLRKEIDAEREKIERLRSRGRS